MSPNQEMLDKLADVAQRLNSSADGVNSILENYEAYIQGLNIGVTAWVEPVSKTGIADVRVCYKGWELGYGKEFGEWELLAREVDGYHSPTYEPNIEGVCSWGNAPLAARLDFVSDLDRLTELLTYAAEEKLKALDDSVAGAFVTKSVG